MSVQREGKKGFSGLQVIGIVLAVTIVTVIVTLLAAPAYFFPKPFEPVVLSPGEQKQLEAKLDRLDKGASSIQIARNSSAKQEPEKSDYTSDGRLRPQKYSEEGASRVVHFTEREVNAIIATNTDLADKLAIDLSDDLVSARMLVPLDPDFPFLGGKVLRVKAGIEVAYRKAKPVVIVRGVSLMGVPLPNAWLGGIKNIDLMGETREQGDGLNAFAEGIVDIQVIEGKIQVKLRE